MQLSEKEIQEFKKLLEKETGKEITFEDASESAHKLLNLFKGLFDFAKEQFGWEQRLKTEPRGFSLEGNGRTCAICKNSMKADENWYDKWGLKCKVCQKAIDRKIIPGSVVKNEDSWYSEYDLKDAFNLTKKHLNNWTKDGLLKARVIENNGYVHTRIFLIKDNKEFLPPKKLVKSQLVKESKDGKDWYHCEPWYKFVDPFEHLKGYRIMEYMQNTKKENYDKEK
jgi:hypothetical protein